MTSPLKVFREALASDWRAALAADEWFFADLNEKVVARLPSNEAFSLLDEVTLLLLAEVDDFLRHECGSLMIALARRAETTAIPPRLDARWEEVMARLSETPSVAEELRRWYRRPAA